VTVGWAGDAVVHAKVDGVMSADLGVRFVAHLGTLTANVTGIHYFCDVSGLDSYDLLARSAFVRFALANRRRFESFTFLAWQGGVSQVARAFAAAIGENVDICSDQTDFERRLTRLAPLARHRLDPANWARLESAERSLR
jgi:hypothetical protein